MDIAIKYSIQLISLSNAIDDFEKALNANMDKYDELEQNWIKNAQVQKFEFCIELLWKTIKSYFETQSEFFLTPKQNIKEMFLHNIINEELYLNLMTCIDDRNKLNHVYKLDLFEEIANTMPLHYDTILKAKNCLIK